MKIISYRIHSLMSYSLESNQQDIMGMGLSNSEAAQDAVKKFLKSSPEIKVSDRLLYEMKDEAKGQNGQKVRNGFPVSMYLTITTE